MTGSSLVTDDQITVALCSVGRPSLTRALSELRAGDTGQIREVIVVDNTDGGTIDREQLADALGPVPLRLLTGSGTASAGRNTAIDNAATDVVVFIDDDCRPSSSWAKEMAAYMATEPSVAAAFGWVEPVEVPGGTVQWTEIPGLGQVAWGSADHEGRRRWCPAVSVPVWQPGIVTGEPTVPWCVVGSSNNLALRRSRLLPGRPAFLPHLGPGTGAGSGEDTELGYALMAAGHHVAFVPEAKVFHDSWLEMHLAERAHRCYVRGNIEALGQHMLAGDRRASELFAKYMGHFRENNEFGLRDLGAILEWAYGDLAPGTERPPLRKSDLT
jgi:glycosyltransferase involved in cell wall biosynthesis